MEIDLAKVAENENVARFVFERSKCKRGLGRVRWDAFITRDGKTSVYRTEGLSEDGIWRIGQEFVVNAYTGPNKGQLQIIGRGDLLARNVIAQGLKLEPEPSPHPRHAIISGWPGEKPDQIEIAKELEKHSTLVLREL